jgi:hypothetical protein
MADEFISSFDGTKLFFNCETGPDDKAVSLSSMVCVNIRAAMSTLPRNSMQQAMAPIALITVAMVNLRRVCLSGRL